MSQNRLARNVGFLDNIYRKGPFEGHGFICIASRTPAWEMRGGSFLLSDKPVKDWLGIFIDDYRRAESLHAVTEDDGVACAKLVSGTHLYAAAFGCDVHVYEDSPACALPLVSTAAEADQLEVPDIWKTPSLYRIFEMGDALRKELGDDVYLGPPDMQTGFDTAALIWQKESMLIAMMDPQEKQAVKRLVDKCAELFKAFLIELRKEFGNLSPCHCPGSWCPPDMGPWMSNDECGIMNTAMFEEFCLPEMIDLAETFGGIGMHCCADAEHQFASFKKIPNFYGFNRVASKRGYEPLLEHFNGADAPVHVLAWIDEERIATLIENSHPDTRYIFNLMGDSVDDGRRWLELWDKYR
ncbi:MAG: hypothetical protein JW936_08380 [Sedimentisphaerales bacterium]|nr:hypothetical protein [Sedimentisphaerales bacterium]